MTKPGLPAVRALDFYRLFADHKCAQQAENNPDNLTGTQHLPVDHHPQKNQQQRNGRIDKQGTRVDLPAAAVEQNIAKLNADQRETKDDARPAQLGQIFCQIVATGGIGENDTEKTYRIADR